METLDLGEILALHMNILGRAGRWPAPVRNEYAIVVVLEQVDSARAGGADIVRCAAIVAVGLIQARPFAYGNVATAFATLECFLSVNGHALALGSERRIGQLLRVIGEEHEAGVATATIEQRLRSVVVPTEPPR